MGLQSAVMYRTVKLFHGSPTMFVLFPLVIYVVTTTLLLVVEGAQALPSQSEIEDAQKIVGRFLRNEAGTNWLSELAITSSAPLSTADLMNAIRRVTRKGGRVWQAATVLTEALESKDLNGTKINSIMGQSDNWKDLIANIELEDDIICLYRKNVNETTKKAEDWRKFLKTVTPGYTVHLAIDTGRKYIICLKRINETTIVEPSTTSEVSTSESELSTTVFTKQAPAETTSQTILRNIQLLKNNDSLMPKNSPDVTTNSDFDSSEENCDDAELDDTKHISEEDIEDYNDLDREDVYDDFEDYKFNDISLEHLRRMTKLRGGMYVEPSVESKVSTELNRPIGRRNYSSRKRPIPSNQEIIGGKIDPRAVGNYECKKPIVFVLPNVNKPVYHSGFPLGIPFRGNPASKPTWPSQNPNYLPRIIGPPYNSPPCSQLKSPYFIPQKNLGQAMIASKIPTDRRSYQSLMKNTHLPNGITPRDQKTVRSFVRPVTKLLQMSRNTLDSQLTTVKSRETNNVQGKPNFSEYPRYPIKNSSPRCFETQSASGIGNKLLLPNRGSLGLDQWAAQSRNIPLPVSRNPEKYDQAGYDLLARLAQVRDAHRIRQTIKNPRDSGFLPPALIHRPQTELPRFAQQPIIRCPPRPFIYDKTHYQHAPIVNQDLLLRAPHSSKSAYNPWDPRLLEFVNSLKNSPNRNYPHFRNNFAQQKRQLGNIVNPMIPIFNRPFATPLNRISAPCALNPLAVELVKCKNLHNCPTVDDPLRNHPVTCSRPCDRPIKLKIMINGQVQEPLSVAVLTEPGQKVEISGSVRPPMPYGSRSLTDRLTVRNEMYDIEKNHRPDVDGGLGEKDREEESSSGSTSVRSDDLTEEKSTTRNETEQEIEERLLHETTIEPIVIETNGTVSTTTNSTNIV